MRDKGIVAGRAGTGTYSRLLLDFLLDFNLFSSGLNFLSRFYLDFELDRRVGPQNSSLQKEGHRRDCTR